MSAGGSGWPSNTLLYVGVSAASAVSRSDPLVARCPLVVTLPGIEQQEQYWQVGARVCVHMCVVPGEGGKAAVCCRLWLTDGLQLVWTQQQHHRCSNPGTPLLPRAVLLLLLLLVLQTVEALLPAGAAAEDKAGLKAAAEAWGQAQGLSVRSAATFARSCGL